MHGQTVEEALQFSTVVRRHCENDRHKRAHVQYRSAWARIVREPLCWGSVRSSLPHMMLSPSTWPRLPNAHSEENRPQDRKKHDGPPRGGPFCCFSDSFNTVPARAPPWCAFYFAAGRGADCTRRGFLRKGYFFLFEKGTFFFFFCKILSSLDCDIEESAPYLFTTAWNATVFDRNQTAMPLKSVCKLIGSDSGPNGRTTSSIRRKTVKFWDFLPYYGSPKRGGRPKNQIKPLECNRF